MWWNILVLCLQFCMASRSVCGTSLVLRWPFAVARTLLTNLVPVWSPFISSSCCRISGIGTTVYKMCFSKWNAPKCAEWGNKGDGGVWEEYCDTAIVCSFKLVRLACWMPLRIVIHISGKVVHACAAAVLMSEYNSYVFTHIFIFICESRWPLFFYITVFVGCCLCAYIHTSLLPHPRCFILLEVFLF